MKNQVPIPYNSAGAFHIMIVIFLCSILNVPPLLSQETFDQDNYFTIKSE